MNKEKFLSSLKEHLVKLPAQIRDDIIADYRAHFEAAMTHGRSEAEIVEALGNPEWLAQEHLDDIQERDQTDGSLPSQLMGKLISAVTSGFSQKNQWFLPKSEADKAIDLTQEREFEWSPGHTMIISVPAAIRWRSALKARIIIRANARLLEHIQVSSQQIKGRFSWGFLKNSHIQIELEGPAIEHWALRGSGDLTLLDVSQDQLHLEVDGSGDMKAAGIAKDVHIAIKGTGEIDISLLKQENTKAEIYGMGDAVIAPTNYAELIMTGDGDIRLTTKPIDMDTRRKVKGKIHLADGTTI